MGSAYFHLEPSATCNGTVVVPGDKSISHRAVMLASLAEGESEIIGFLPSTDCEATLNAFQNMGVQIERIDDTHVRIQGVGLKGLRAPSNVLNMGNSGTAMRLMAGILSGQSFSSTLVGDASLSSRPMQRIQTPLKKMAANIASEEGYIPPLVIQPSSKLVGIDYSLPIPSAQVKSCVLLAGLYAQGKTCVKENTSTRDHTERMLQTFSYPIEVNHQSVCVEGGGKLIASKIEIPGDISSAAFLIVAALISKNSTLTIRNVGINPTRDGVIQILRLMGADILISNKRNMGMEPVGDLLIQSSELHGIEIPQSLIANSIDEFPIIFIAAACAQGVTTLNGAEELRVKESDRIAVMASGLQKLGISVYEKPDGLVITGGKIQGGEIDSGGDHRIAMAFAIASIQANAVITVRNTENVMTSFPNFVGTVSNLGLKVSQH
ncbi:MAG: 3-phosphoshikimate 1-carboxyvinyltransferase [Gammaproteobacteria bacterium]|nr:3-phosphoshikimate 1-carboxyvinyltransferase [Gammaproteobacteria bacterium]